MFVAAEPSRCILNTSALSNSRVNASCEPSGDQIGATSCELVRLTLVFSLPSPCMTQI
jgi:hypothetical protein